MQLLGFLFQLGFPVMVTQGSDESVDIFVDGSEKK